MHNLIDIILRNGVSAGPGHEAVLQLPVTSATSQVFNTRFREDDCLSVQTDGVKVTVNIVNDESAFQAALDKRIAGRLLEYLFFGGMKTAAALTRTIAA